MYNHIPPQYKNWVDNARSASPGYKSKYIGSLEVLSRIEDESGHVTESCKREAKILVLLRNESFRRYTANFQVTSDRSDLMFSRSGYSSAEMAGTRNMQGYDLYPWDASIKCAEDGFATIDLFVKRDNLTRKGTNESSDRILSHSIKFESQSSVVPKREATILILSPEWFPAHGGLPKFNRALCKQLADKKRYRIVCFVPLPKPDEIVDAAGSGVTLVGPKLKRTEYVWESLAWQPDLPETCDVEMVIGHDRHTGTFAHYQKQTFYHNAKMVVFVHTEAADLPLYSAKDLTGVSTKIAKRETDLREIVLSSDAAFAVGPRLVRATRDTLGADFRGHLSEFIPGFEVNQEPARVNADGSFRILILGRLGEEEAKGLDIAIRAFNRINKEISQREIKLALLGVRSGEENNLISKMESEWGGRRNVELLPYTSITQDVEHEIRRSNVVIMPSRTEGFGLVGWEALSHGIPVLISSKSGFAEYLKREIPEHTSGVIIDMACDDNSAVERFKNALERVIANEDSAREVAIKMLRNLATKGHWDNGVSQILSLLSNESI